MSEPVISVGLRFERGQARRLEEIAVACAQSDNLRPHASLFHQAAEAAAGPDGLLIVKCFDPMEALLMAAAFPRYGVKQPVVEQLSPARA